MSEIVKYRVVREHGEFAEGETREASPTDVAHLVPHVLDPIETKAEPTTLNKAEGAAPANKAARPRKSKDT